MSDLTEYKKAFNKYMLRYAPKQLKLLFEELSENDGIMLEVCFAAFADMAANEAAKQGSGLTLQRVNGCLSQQDAKLFYDYMLKWEQNDLIDYSLMKGADYMQRTLAKILGVDYRPK